MRDINGIPYLESGFVTTAKEIDTSITLDETYFVAKITASCSPTLPNPTAFENHQYYLINTSGVDITFSIASGGYIGNIGTANSFTLKNGASIHVKNDTTRWLILGVAVDFSLKYKTTTTNNTLTTLATLTIPNNESKVIEFFLKGRDSAGVTYGGRGFFVVTNISGTTTIVSTLDYLQRSQMAGTVIPSVAVSGADVLIKIKSPAGVTAVWDLEITKIL